MIYANEPSFNHYNNKNNSNNYITKFVLVIMAFTIEELISTTLSYIMPSITTTHTHY